MNETEAPKLPNPVDRVRRVAEKRLAAALLSGNEDDMRRYLAHASSRPAYWVDTVRNANELYDYLSDFFLGKPNSDFPPMDRIHLSYTMEYDDEGGTYPSATVHGLWTEKNEDGDDVDCDEYLDAEISGETLRDLCLDDFGVDREDFLVGRAVFVKNIALISFSLGTLETAANGKD